jgi:hypothetical protein
VISAVRRLALLFQQVLIKIAPLRIALLDQFEFPSSAPFLDLLFARDGINHRGVKLYVDEAIDAVPLRKTLYGTGSVSQTRRAMSLVTPV